MWGMSMAYPNPFSSGFVEQVDKVQAATGEDQTAAPRYCEACDRDFGSLKDYEAHIAAHVPCPVRGCNFKGARRAVNIHLDDAHSNDKAKKPLVTDTPEDIKRWIAERKKNWPSAANMERKAKELLETKSSSPAGGLKRKGGDDQRSVRPCRKWANGRCSFGDKCHFSHAEPQKKRPKRPCNNFAKGKCKHGERCRYSHDPNDAGQQPQKMQKKVKPSLLTKLLSSEIENEKTLVLQCLRYIVDLDFFQKQQ
eukprot:TRINITY_DN19670_c0_g1_i2.p1 TRINITY_DN19670_c0_g1~~TRINITY_DN19670_c0_g1_i2.p1  ORF type:complete len:252 (+),score=36.86 TRINITY_DN19670_c0_g1_i2:51-806(+)